MGEKDRFLFINDDFRFTDMIEDLFFKKEEKFNNLKNKSFSVQDEEYYFLDFDLIANDERFSA